MRLKEYIKSNGYNYRTFASAIGINFRNIEMWSRGERLPRWKDAKRIFEFTNNEVTGQDLYDEQIQRNETEIQRQNI